MTSEIAPGFHWIGVVDWGLRHFHGFELSTHRGSAYNAFLFQDEKIAVMDTVWAPFTDEFIANVRSLVDPATIDYVIINHAEPDHSGALPALMQLCPQATIIASKKGADSITGHYHQAWKIQTVTTGTRLSLGRRELTFFEAPMLHWPDTMFTYVAPDQVLVSNDAFGQHYATAFRFNDQVSEDELNQEAVKYYANILTPYSDRVIKKIDELLALNLPISMILPSHGVMWRKDPLQIVRKYQEWAQQKGAPQAVVLFDSMWDATRRMAEAIGDGLTLAGTPNKLFYLPVSDRNDVITEVFKAKAVVMGSCTHNNSMLPAASTILHDIHGLKIKHKIGAAFGSYGWSGESVRQIEEQLTKSGVTLVAEGIRVKWQPTAANLDACRQLGAQVAAAINAGK